MDYNKKKTKYSQSEQEVFSSFRSVRLTEEEKNAVWKQIASSIQGERKPFPSSIFERFSQLFVVSMKHSFTMAMILLIAVVGSGFGIARASENALPGQKLYPLKTNVNEVFIGSLKRSPADRAEWERELAERRIREAETLAEEGHLGEEEKNEIEQHLIKNRKNLESIEGRKVRDEEFFPKDIETVTKKIRVRTEHTETDTFIHIDEKLETEEDEAEELEHGFIDEEEQHVSDDNFSEQVSNNSQSSEQKEPVKEKNDNDDEKNIQSKKYSSDEKKEKQQEKDVFVSQKQGEEKKKQEIKGDKKDTLKQEDVKNNSEDEKDQEEDNAHESDDEDVHQE